MSDVICAKCREPWDSYCLRLEKHDCEACDGTGTVELDSAEVAPGVDGSIYLMANSECPSEPCETCNRTGRVPDPNDPEDTERCDDCGGDGYVSRPDTCDTCGDEFTYGYSGHGMDLALVCDGSLTCMSCAEKAGDVVTSKACEECKGAGKVEAGADALTPDDIRRFRRGEGCPACKFGTACPPCDGSGRDREFYPLTGRRYDRGPCPRCRGTGELPADPDAAIDAARTAVDASDEEPMGILIERGII